MFRDKSPYTFPGGVAKIVLHNAARVAEVWLDEWRDFYYAMSTGTSLTTSLKQRIFGAHRLISLDFLDVVLQKPLQNIH